MKPLQKTDIDEFKSHFRGEVLLPRTWGTTKCARSGTP